MATRVVESTLAVVKFKKKRKRSTSTSEADTEAATEAEKSEEPESVEASEMTEEMDEDLGLALFDLLLNCSVVPQTNILMRILAAI